MASGVRIFQSEEELKEIKGVIISVFSKKDMPRVRLYAQLVDAWDDAELRFAGFGVLVENGNLAGYRWFELRNYGDNYTKAMRAMNREIADIYTAAVQTFNVEEDL